MTDVDVLIDALVPREGGYSNDPDDHGGQTIFGITAATARAFGYQGVMAEMTRETAATIYRARFWEQPGFATLDSLDSVLAAKCFDIGVNMGPATAVRFIQRALNVLNYAKGWAVLDLDGGFGKLTQHALASFLAMRGSEGRQVMLAMVRAQQCVAYIEDAERDRSQAKFEWGWQRARTLI